jgi:hypothetical protein
VGLGNSTVTPGAPVASTSSEILSLTFTGLLPCEVDIEVGVCIVGDNVGLDSTVEYVQGHRGVVEEPLKGSLLFFVEFLSQHVRDGCSDDGFQFVGDFEGIVGDFFHVGDHLQSARATRVILHSSVKTGIKAIFIKSKT